MLLEKGADIEAKDEVTKIMGVNVNCQPNIIGSLEASLLWMILVDVRRISGHLFTVLPRRVIRRSYPCCWIKEQILRRMIRYNNFL